MRYVTASKQRLLVAYLRLCEARGWTTISQHLRVVNAQGENQ